MIFFLLLALCGAIGFTSFYLGFGAGQVKNRKALNAATDGLHELDTFASQQAAAGDTTGSVVVDMIHNIKKELR